MRREIAKNRLRNRRAERQRQICKGAMKVFKKKGFNATTIREIARASQVSIGNLYNYIDKKEDILILIYDDVVDSIYEQFNKVLISHKDPVDLLVNAISNTYDMTFQLKDEVLFIYTETKSLGKPQLRKILKRESQFVETIELLIEKIAQKLKLEFKYKDIIANIIVFLFAMCPLRGWNILPKRSKEEIRASLIQFIMRGAGVPAKEIRHYIH